MKQMKRFKNRAKVENNFYSTMNYIKPVTPRINVSLNSRDFSIKGVSSLMSLLCAGNAGVQYIMGKEYVRSLKASLFLGIITGLIEVKDYMLSRKSQKKNDANDSECDDSATDNAFSPKDQSVDNIRNERTFANYDDGQLVGKLVYIGDKVIIFSEFGTGKTVLMMGIALDIAYGRVSKIVPIDNGLHIPQTVFYYDGENDPEDYVKIFGGHAINTEKLHIIRKFFFRSIKEWLKDVREKLKGVHGNVTVILDNLSCVTSSFNADVMRELFLSEFTKIQNEFSHIKITFIVVAHTNKQKELMGSNNQNNFATTVLKLSKKDDNYLNLEVIKNRKYGDMAGKTLLLAKRETEDGFKFDEYVSDSVPPNEEKKTSKADNIPPEIKQKMKGFYQKDVPGHGYASVIKEFELDTKYGITEANEVKRIIESLEKE